MDGEKQQVLGLHRTPEKWSSLEWAVNCVDICALWDLELSAEQGGCISLPGCTAYEAQRQTVEGARQSDARGREGLGSGTWHTLRISIYGSSTTVDGSFVCAIVFAVLREQSTQEKKFKESNLNDRFWFWLLLLSNNSTWNSGCVITSFAVKQ